MGRGRYARRSTDVNGPRVPSPERLGYRRGSRHVHLASHGIVGPEIHGIESTPDAGGVHVVVQSSVKVTLSHSETRVYSFEH